MNKIIIMLAVMFLGFASICMADSVEDRATDAYNRAMDAVREYQNINNQISDEALRRKACKYLAAAKDLCNAVIEYYNERCPNDALCREYIRNARLQLTEINSEQRRLNCIKCN